MGQGIFLIYEVERGAVHAWSCRRDAPALRPTLKPWGQTDAFCEHSATPGKYGDKEVSSQGFIATPEVPREPPAGVCRILFLPVR